MAQLWSRDGRRQDDHRTDRGERDETSHVFLAPPADGAATLRTPGSLPCGNVSHLTRAPHGGDTSERAWQGWPSPIRPRIVSRRPGPSNPQTHDSSKSKHSTRLREGNRRFVASIKSGDATYGQTRRVDLGSDQAPFAIILGCSDARVPAEIVFDQGLGDLFVIRVAGNIVAPSQVGSVEFAASRFGTRLVVVLGHSKCGAILATIEELQRPAENQSRNLRSIVDRVRPRWKGC